MRALTTSLAPLLASALLLLPCLGVADDKLSDIQVWPLVAINHGFGEDFGFHLQARGRFDDDVSETKDYLIRPFFTWRAIEGVTLDLGYDYLHSFTGSTEHRIWQAGQHHLKWRGFTLANRIRIDQRFVEGVNGVVARFRYRLRTTHPIGSSSLYGALSNEVFANMNERSEGPGQGFEQNRLRFALGGEPLKWLKVESGYEYQYSESRSGIGTNIHMYFVEFSIATGNKPLLGWAPR